MASETEVYRKHIERLQMVSHLTDEEERFKAFRFLNTFLELTYINLFCLEGKCCWKTDKYSGKRLAFTQSRRASFQSKKTVWRTKYLKTGSFKNKTRGIDTLAYADGGISGQVQLLLCFGGGASRRFGKSCSAAKKVSPTRHISHPANHPARYEGYRHSYWHSTTQTRSLSTVHDNRN